MTHAHDDRSIDRGPENRAHVPTGVIIPVWLASILVISLIGSVMGIIHNQGQNRLELSILTVKMESLIAQTAVNMDLRYRSTEADKDFKLRDLHIKHLDEDVVAIKMIIEGCQKRMRAIEDEINKVTKEIGD